MHCKETWRSGKGCDADVTRVRLAHQCGMQAARSTSRWRRRTIRLAGKSNVTCSWRDQHDTAQIHHRKGNYEGRFAGS